MRARHLVALTILSFLTIGAAGCGPEASKAVPTVPDTPDGTVLFVAEQLKAQNPQLIWDALPATYQLDITQVTHDFAAKMDAELYNQLISLVHKAVVILKDKKQYIAESSVLQMEAEDKDELMNGWDTGLSFMETLLTSEVANLETLKTIDIRNFLETTGTALMKQTAEASANQPDDPYTTEFLATLEQMQVEVLATEGETAKLRITVPDEDPEEVDMVRVEGRWVPAEMAETWQEDMTEAKAKIAEISEEEMAQTKMQAAMILAMADTFLDQLAAVESTEEFDALVKGLMGSFMGGEAPSSP